MSDPLFQNSLYIGNTFNAILYGIEITLYYNTMSILWRKKEKDARATRFYMAFSTAAFLLVTIFVAVEAVFGQEMWIVNANFPGGSAAYLATYASVWYQTMGTAASVILQLMSDGVLIYRCFVVWNNLYVLIFPCVLWVATLILGIFELYTSGVPTGNAFEGLAAHIGVTYCAVSVGLNVIVTAMICGRIGYLGMAIHTTSTKKSMAKYTGTIPIIVESGLAYAVSGIAFVVSLGIGSEISILFLSLYVMFTCISPQMIILRVADGKAWERQQLNDASAIVLNTFGDNHTSVESGLGQAEAL
ncbi:hypothetical protein HYDPIDRAFT_27050 [Hydnomerulius pinastri MD-312]|nr:hypothetical protein HYDPIDRAFT_27050 [Hydnomerulius pinastri MD-312]